MSIAAMQACWSAEFPDEVKGVSPALVRAVSLAVADHVNPDRGNRFTGSITHLAEKSRVGRKVAGQVVAHLVASDVIRVLGKVGNNVVAYEWVWDPSRVDSTQLPRRVDAETVKNRGREIEHASSSSLLEQTDCHSVTPVPAEPSTFDDFWAAYPRHVGKAEAKRKFEVACRRTPAATIVTAAARQAAHWRSIGKDPQYIKHPATWLHQGCWEDDLEAPPRPSRLSPVSMAERHIEREYAEQGLQVPTRAQIEAWQAEDPDFGRRPPPPPEREFRPLPALGSGL